MWNWFNRLKKRIILKRNQRVFKLKWKVEIKYWVIKLRKEIKLKINSLNHLVS